LISLFSSDFVHVDVENCQPYDVLLGHFSWNVTEIMTLAGGKFTY